MDVRSLMELLRTIPSDYDVYVRSSESTETIPLIGVRILESDSNGQIAIVLEGSEDDV